MNMEPENDLGPGLPVLLFLREPREKSWGILLKMEAAGLWVMGIEINAFEDWAREVARGGPSTMGLSTFFVPLLRLEKMVADEPTGSAPSLVQRFEAIAGRSLEDYLQSESGEEEEA